jgi:hypothetical protein
MPEITDRNRIYYGASRTAYSKLCDEFYFDSSGIRVNMHAHSARQVTARSKNIPERLRDLLLNTHVYSGDHQTLIQDHTVTKCVWL